MSRANELEDRRTLIMSELMTPDKANLSGKVHGGMLMMILDRVAEACAARYSGKYCVTLSVDRILFKKPIHIGELVIFYANVNYVGTSSMEIGIRVVAEDLHSGEQRHTNSCYLTMVALGDDHKPVRIKPLEMRDEEDQKHFDAAVLRRKMQREFADKMQEVFGE